MQLTECKKDVVVVITKPHPRHAHMRGERARVLETRHANRKHPVQRVKVHGGVWGPAWFAPEELEAAK